MTTTLAPAISLDIVMSFEINPGSLLQFLESRAEGGPRLKCFEGSVTLVSPGMSHETAVGRLTSLILALCLELHIRHKALASTTWTLPLGAGDTAYEADAAYYIQSYDKSRKQIRPDLAIEVVVSHPASKALQACAVLEIPELWVLDLPRHKLTFYHLVRSGKHKGSYRPQARSLAFPELSSTDVQERLDDPEADDTAYHENCREWVRRVILPRRIDANEGG